MCLSNREKTEGEREGRKERGGMEGGERRGKKKRGAYFSADENTTASHKQGCMMQT